MSGQVERWLVRLKDVCCGNNGKHWTCNILIMSVVPSNYEEERAVECQIDALDMLVVTLRD